MTETVPGRTASRLKLIALALIFVAPLAAATVYYYWVQAHGGPAHTTNHGHLLAHVHPLYDYDASGEPRPIAALEQAHLHHADGTKADPSLFRDKWTLLYVAHGKCAKLCKQRLYDTRQVRAATGQDAGRIRRVLIMVEPRPGAGVQAFAKRVHPDLAVLFTSSATPLLRFFRPGPQARPSTGAGRVYLIDPHGNWLMYYTRQDSASGMLKDLQKLLRISTIG